MSRQVGAVRTCRFAAFGGDFVFRGPWGPVLKRVASAGVGLLLASACARAPQSAPSPQPAKQPVASGTESPRTGATVSPRVSVAQQAAKPAKPPAAHRDSTAVDSVVVDSSDVSRREKEIFGDSTVARVADATDSSAGPSWDIDVRSYESKSKVERYVQLFTGPAKDHIEEQLSRGTRYEPLIRAKFRAGGLPEDLYYLALVESGFDPNAYSSAAAVGMWQFMTSTGRDMGMRVDWWVDERRDPVKSTIAAVRFIKDLQEQFGSLYLAAAAYNGGPGRIARGLTRYAGSLEGTTGDDLFFALADKKYLRSETREYVPQLIAGALIAKEPARYGLKIDSQPPFAYDSVRVGPATPLAAIAKASNATIAQIQELNPQILRGMTPPKDSLQIRIPVGASVAFAAALDALDPAELAGISHVESKKGQSMASIATKNGLTAKQLAAYNPHAKRLKSGNLAPGQTLVVPTLAVAAAAANVPDPAIERYSHGGTTHVVRAGETIGGIAKRFHTTTAAIMRANGLKRALIFPGQSLVVPGATRRSSSVADSPAPKKRKVGASTTGTHSPNAQP